jgi:hypothetical protein
MYFVIMSIQGAVCKVAMEGGSCRGTWEYNIRMNSGETGWAFVDWIVLAQDKNSGELY